MNHSPESVGKQPLETDVHFKLFTLIKRKLNFSVILKKDSSSTCPPQITKVKSYSSSHCCLFWKWGCYFQATENNFVKNRDSNEEILSFCESPPFVIRGFQVKGPTCRPRVLLFHVVRARANGHIVIEQNYS